MDYFKTLKMIRKNLAIVLEMSLVLKTIFRICKEMTAIVNVWDRENVMKNYLLNFCGKVNRQQSLYK